MFCQPVEGLLKGLNLRPCHGPSLCQTVLSLSVQHSLLPECDEVLKQVKIAMIMMQVTVNLINPMLKLSASAPLQAELQTAVVTHV